MVKQLENMFINFSLTPQNSVHSIFIILKKNTMDIHLDSPKPNFPFSLHTIILLIYIIKGKSMPSCSSQVHSSPKLLIMHKQSDYTILFCLLHIQASFFFKKLLTEPFHLFPCRLTNPLHIHFLSDIISPFIIFPIPSIYRIYLFIYPYFMPCNSLVRAFGIIFSL